MKILVTGGAGFIGSHIVEHFQDQAEVWVLDNLRSGYRKNLEGFSVSLIEGSVLDRVLVSQIMSGIDYVFHLAALVSVPESMEKPAECVQINTLGLLNVLESAAAAGVKKLCFCSSAAVYGDNPIVPKIETMPPEPRSPYAMTKVDGEYYCDLFRQQGKLNTVSLRYFNVFGPRQDPKSQYAAAVPIFIDKAVRNENIAIFGDGEQTRDFIYVKDVAAANAFAAATPAVSGVFNVACGRRMSINDLARRIVHLTESKSAIYYLPERPGDVKHSLASPEKLMQAGFSPSFQFNRGLQATIDYFRREQKS
jgi:UDP-glucose 4-epimerase